MADVLDKTTLADVRAGKADRDVMATVAPKLSALLTVDALWMTLVLKSILEWRLG